MISGPISVNLPASGRKFGFTWAISIRFIFSCSLESGLRCYIGGSFVGWNGFYTQTFRFFSLWYFWSDFWAYAFSKSSIMLCFIDGFSFIFSALSIFTNYKLILLFRARHSFLSWSFLPLYLVKNSIGNGLFKNLCIPSSKTISWDFMTGRAVFAFTRLFDLWSKLFWFLVR